MWHLIASLLVVFDLFVFSRKVFSAFQLSLFHHGGQIYQHVAAFSRQNNYEEFPGRF